MRTSLPADSKRPRLPRGNSDRGGFILIVIVGMLAVLVILGLSFAEQGRIELTGAINTRDLAAIDNLGEAGFEFAKRALADDSNVWTTANTKWASDVAKKGVGWTSRWGYATGYDRTVANQGLITPVAGSPNNNGPAPNRADPRNLLNPWQMPFWNEEGIGAGYAFYFKTPESWPVGKDDPAQDTNISQRYASDVSALTDWVQLQPLAAARRFRVQVGNASGWVKVAVTPLDGGINLNDVFAPGTVSENAGWYETYPTAAPNYGLGQSVGAEHNHASPDRRTLEYILGKRPEYATRNLETGADPNLNGEPYGQDRGNLLSGNWRYDDGEYNFRSYFEPKGYYRDGGNVESVGQYEYPSNCYGRLGTRIKKHPLVFYNSNTDNFYYYNFEAPRYVVWAPSMGMSLRLESTTEDDNDPSARWLIGTPRNDSNWYAWYPPGRYLNHPGVLPNDKSENYNRDIRFTGFGFDMKDPRRGGEGSAVYKYDVPSWSGIPGQEHYTAAGVYGHPKAHSFQYHMIAKVANGRFWSDLMASWYFGGAPGYTSLLGQAPGKDLQNDQKTYSNWTHLGSSYDSLGMGTHWMPPTTHVWTAGFWGEGRLNAEDMTRGLSKDPGNMPPVFPAATYAYPRRRFNDDMPLGNAHFLFNDVRVGIRAYGIQEPWGLYDQAPTALKPGRMYDAIDINNTNFQVVYGLLTPEKIPSMLNRTVVAPHLHWKARYLDAAYVGMEKFWRYKPDTTTGRYDYDVDGDGKIDNIDPDDRKPAWDRNGDNNPDWDVNGDGIIDAKDKDYDPYSDTAYYKDRKDIYIPVPGTRVPLDPAPPAPEVVENPPVDLAIAAPNLHPYGHIKDENGPYAPGAEGVTVYDPTSAEPEKHWIGPSDYRCSIHRHYEPLPVPGTDWATIRRIYGKMDFGTPDPMTGVPADDVFPDSFYDMYLYDFQRPRPTHPQNHPDWFLQRNTVLPEGTGTPPSELGIQRPEKFMDDLATFYPISLKYIGDVLLKPEGQALSIDIVGGAANTAPTAGSLDAGASDPVGTRYTKNTAQVAVPHPIYGLPNPNYMLLQPGMYRNAGSATIKNVFWADQFRRYFPLDILNGEKFNRNRAPLKENKMFEFIQREDKDPAPDENGLHYDATRDRVNPYIPVGKNILGHDKSRWVPAIGPDEGWRITRIGRKYQEIIADEIMDYQINPWWPNPVIQRHPDPKEPTTNDMREESVPLEKGKWEPVTRGDPTNVTEPKWASYEVNTTDPVPVEKNIKFRVPAYYAYFNRFWVRTPSKQVRGWKGGFVTSEGILTIAADSANIVIGQPYEGDENPIENRGIYPRAFSYYGQATDGVQDLRKDRILDFPQNSLEDALGAHWRYQVGTLSLSSYEAMRYAPARNHPFKNWADFVAFLGHLVYRSPLIPSGTAYPNVIIKQTLGVNAYKVCHAKESWVDTRNRDQFFDGSKIATGEKVGPENSYEDAALADSLQGYKPGTRDWNQAIVAMDGYWPLSGNYGAYPDPMTAGIDPADQYMYPTQPSGAPPWDDVEWRRRIDELRGRDEAGLRIEQHYISERAANDILVSLSNGRVGPIDFDGDGHVTMTRRSELHSDPDDYPTSTTTAPKHRWRVPYGYPWHDDKKNSTTAGGGFQGVEYQPRPGLDDDANKDPAKDNFGIKDSSDKFDWKAAKKGEVIQGCVTLPIKFRSNTFRVSVVAELTDVRQRNTLAVRRYSRIVSRVPGTPTGGQVHGPYTGKFIQHNNRVMTGTDPVLKWLGAE